MDEFPLPADKLKKLVKVSRDIPIAFGFNPGTDEGDAYLAAHRRKPPEMLGKLAKNEGAGTKSAYGTFMVAGSVMSLTCIRVLPNLAKLFKRMLRSNKIMLNVQILDENGNVIESDIEELPDPFAGEPDDEDEDSDGQHGEAAVETQTAASETDDPSLGVDAGELTQRLRALQPRITALQGAAGEKLAAAFKGAVALMKAGQLDKSAATLDQIEAVLARLGSEQPAQGEARAADPRLSKLAEAVQKLREQAQAYPDAQAQPMLQTLDRIAGQIDAGEAEAAMGGLREVQAGLKALTDAQAKWDAAVAKLEPLVTAALTSRSPDAAARLRTPWGFAQDLAAEGFFERATAALPNVIAELRNTAETTGQPPEGGVAFQSSRIVWVAARAKMMAEVQRLADSIVEQSADDEDAENIREASRLIVNDVASIDNRLQDMLDDLTNAEGPARDVLKKRAAGVLAEYQAMLSSGIFAVVDANPFVPVAVTATARTALGSIARTLS